MTIFRDVEDTCRVPVNWYNCLRCYVSNKAQYLKCKEEFRKYLISHKFASFFQDYNPYPRTDREFEAHKEDRMSISPEFTKFVNRYFTALEKLKDQGSIRRNRESNLNSIQNRRMLHV